MRRRQNEGEVFGLFVVTHKSSWKWSNVHVHIPLHPASVIPRSSRQAHQHMDMLRLHYSTHCTTHTHFCIHTCTEWHNPCCMMSDYRIKFKKNHQERWGEERWEWKRRRRFNADFGGQLKGWATRLMSRQVALLHKQPHTLINKLMHTKPPPGWD